MRLTEDQIVDLLLHEDKNVRRLALLHVRETGSSHPALFAQLVKAYERFGREEAFAELVVWSEIDLPADGLPWLVQEYANLQAIPETENDEDEEGFDETATLLESYRDDLEEALFRFHPALLLPYREQLFSAPAKSGGFEQRFNGSQKETSTTAKEAWEKLVAWRAQTIAAYAEAEEQDDFEPPHVALLLPWIDILRREIATAPREEICNRLREMTANGYSYPESVLVGHCLKLVKHARTWTELLPTIVPLAFKSEYEDDYRQEAQEALARFPEELVLPELRRVVDEESNSLAEVLIICMAYRSDAVIQLLTSLAPSVEHRMDAGLLVEALCLQYDSAAFQQAAEIAREHDVWSLGAQHLMGAAVALNIEHPDHQAWSELVDNEELRTQQIVQIMLETHGCGPDCDHDHEHDHPHTENAFDEEIEELLQDEHACGPGCGHDHSHDHDHRPAFVPPMSPETFKHDTIQVGRNDACPCGSGKKFKKCCMTR